eukprot:scaffold87776_cov71-Attheya_sp.AAC.2
MAQMAGFRQPCRYYMCRSKHVMCQENWRHMYCHAIPSRLRGIRMHPGSHCMYCLGQSANRGNTHLGV